MRINENLLEGAKNDIKLIVGMIDKLLAETELSESYLCRLVFADPAFKKRLLEGRVTQLTQHRSVERIETFAKSIDIEI